MRHRRLKKLWKRLHELQGQTLDRDQLLIKIGAAKKEAGRAFSLVELCLPEPGQEGCRPALVPSRPRDTSPGPVLPRGAQSTKSPTTF